MFFIFKTTYKIISVFLMILGAYYLYSTNFQPTDFWNDSKKLVQNNFPGLNTDIIKEEANKKINQILADNKDSAKEVVEEKVKEVIDLAVDETNKKAQDVINELQNSKGIDAETIKANNPTGKIIGCKKGYYFSEVFVSGCVQINCTEIENAYVTDTGRCECKGEKKECFNDLQNEDCPGCMFACVAENENCN